MSVQRKDFHPTAKLWFVWPVLFWAVFSLVMWWALA